MIVIQIDPRCTPDHVGLIPSFLVEEDMRSASEQFDARYVGGWRHQDGFTTRNNCVLFYPGDPPLYPLAMIPFRDEAIYIYEYGYVAIFQKDGSFEACRVD